MRDFSAAVVRHGSGPLEEVLSHVLDLLLPGSAVAVLTDATLDGGR
jgi:hypothetical protein